MVTTTPYIALVGGDKREVVLGTLLSKESLSVKMVGFENYARVSLNRTNSLEDVLATSSVLILPLSGVNENGRVMALYSEKELILTFEMLSLIQGGSLLLSGSLPEKIKCYLQNRDVEVLETLKLEELSLLNAIPTAEGALQTAMENSEVTLHNSRALLLGFGRCAKALAFKLKGLNSSVTIAARSLAARAEAEMYGYCALPLDDLARQVDTFNFIFNTIPALVLTQDILKIADPKTIIIDVASKPGGVDFAAADKYGFCAKLVPGIPGKVAPVSAGQILAKVYRPLLVQYFSKDNFHTERGDFNETKGS